ncbi:MAG TPA: hypothetical protein VFV05_05905 [Methylomirabilota bacterium]|nr:hypothetical protein [Methylomirabilota bacterium]
MRLVPTLLLVIAAVFLPAAAGAQELVPAGPSFRAEVEPDLLGRRGPAIVGWLYNDHTFSVSNVRVRVDVVDAGGQTLTSGEGWVYGNVPAGGRAYFFVPVPRYGAGYRVAVLRFDRLQFE